MRARWHIPLLVLAGVSFLTALILVFTAGDIESDEKTEGGPAFAARYEREPDRDVLLGLARDYRATYYYYKSASFAMYAVLVFVIGGLALGWGLEKRKRAGAGVAKVLRAPGSEGNWVH
jgi:hypothetical protein